MAVLANSTTDGQTPPPPKKAFWKGLGFQIAISMILGIIVGFVWPELSDSLKILGDIFLRLVKSAVAPLIFLTVALGIGATGDIKKVGKVGLSALIYFEVVSTIAIIFGFGMGELFNVGGFGTIEHIDVASNAPDLSAAHAPQTFGQFLFSQTALSAHSLGGSSCKSWYLLYSSASVYYCSKRKSVSPLNMVSTLLHKPSLNLSTSSCYLHRLVHLVQSPMR